MKPFSPKTKKLIGIMFGACPMEVSIDSKWLFFHWGLPFLTCNTVYDFYSRQSVFLLLELTLDIIFLMEKEIDIASTLFALQDNPKRNEE
jgi:hypothetical protein